MSPKTCLYCDRTILNEEVYNLHTENCSRHPKFHSKYVSENTSMETYDEFLSQQFLKSMIIQSSSHIQNITKIRLIKLLQCFMYGMPISEKDSDYLFLQKIIEYIQSNKKILYSLKEREDVINQVLYNHFLQLEVIP